MRWEQADLKELKYCSRYGVFAMWDLQERRNDWDKKGGFKWENLWFLGGDAF